RLSSSAASDVYKRQGCVAAVCVYPRFIEVAKHTLQALNVSEQVMIATVVNFPYGVDSITQVEQDINVAIAAGAHEIDLVLPYRQLMAGHSEFAQSMVQAAKAICVEASMMRLPLDKPILLKVIIESGELATGTLITQASKLAIDGGADFIKTSTGKVARNATLMAAELMLTAIRDSGKNVGFKAAGGVCTTAEALQYLQLAASIMGKDWLTPVHFRLGASGLLTQLLSALKDET
ncbi:MAG: deoxyribose-phosphate aldolase, partial [Candidatus Oceanisphaera merdipullorum]|nr:deoxyribose-phosphate aldolase [Candidatus Oceanisphaera merdipullorum]